MPPAGTVADTGNTRRRAKCRAYAVRAFLAFASSRAVPFNPGFCLTRSREGREELAGWGVPQSRRLSMAPSRIPVKIRRRLRDPTTPPMQRPHPEGVVDYLKKSIAAIRRPQREVRQDRELLESKWLKSPYAATCENSAWRTRLP
jgi:hypothetical protein